VKNRIKLFFTELLAPIQPCQVLGDEIAPIPEEILEIAGTEIVNHRQARVRKFILEGKGEVGADESGAAGDEKIGSG